MKKRPGLACLLLVSVALWLSGCAALPSRNPLPDGYDDMAQVPGIPHARVWGDVPPPFYEEVVGQTREQAKQLYPGIFGNEHHYLALSGGGADGAFGAGMMVGWSAAGTRPEFTMVTGTSTGALMAPFVFLGEAYDDQLKEMYTTYSTRDLVIRRDLLAAVTGISAADTTPLKNMLARYLDRQVMEAIAAEFQKGRRLWIGTVNLDARRPVIWNIGRIASSGQPGALDLIHDVIVASASIPAAFPPVFIEVEAGGRRYDEMHVDGGTASQVFLYPTGVRWSRLTEILETRGQPRVYVVRNSPLRPEYEPVRPKILDISKVSISSLIRTQGIGDMYRIYLDCQRDGMDFNLAYIPDDFDLEPKEAFDPVYMGALFELGFEMALKGYPWDKAPPGY